MRWNAVFVRLQVKGEFLRIKPAGFHSLDHLAVLVYALTSAIYFKPAEQQVKAARERRFFRVLVCIKSAPLRRERRYENEV